MIRYSKEVFMCRVFVPIAMGAARISAETDFPIWSPDGPAAERDSSMSYR
jgi:hypothetical protein